jgi:hypothetical protein
MRTKIVAVVIVLLVLVSSVFVIGTYPRLQIDHAAHAIMLSSNSIVTSGFITVDITGSGIYTIASVSVSEDITSLYAQIQPARNLPLKIHLPAQLLIYVQSEVVIVSPLTPSTVIISLVGTWSYEFINMPVSLTVSTNVQWTSYSIEALASNPESVMVAVGRLSALHTVLSLPVAATASCLVLRRKKSKTV